MTVHHGGIISELPFVVLHVNGPKGIEKRIITAVSGAETAQFPTGYHLLMLVRACTKRESAIEADKSSVTISG